MQMLARFTFVVALAVGSGCEPPVATPAAPPPTSVALFDPLGSPPVVPTPNDLAFRGGDGMHLNVPDLPTDSPAQRSLNAYLRTLNGFPASSTAATSFSGAARSGQRDADLADGARLGDHRRHHRGDAGRRPRRPRSLSADGKTLDLVPATQWTAGHRYAVLLFGGTDAAGLRGAAGETVIASPAFFFLRSPNPLVARCGDSANPDCVCPSSAVADPTDTSCHSVVLGLERRRRAPGRAAAAHAAEALGTALAGGGARPRARTTSCSSGPSPSRRSRSPSSIRRPATSRSPTTCSSIRRPGLVNLPIAPGDPMASLKMALNTLDGFSVSAPETIGVDGPGADRRRDARAQPFASSS